MKICSKCGTQNQEGVNFCTNCGGSLINDENNQNVVVQENNMDVNQQFQNENMNMQNQESQINVTIPEQKKKSKLPIILLIVFGALILFVGLIIAVIVIFSAVGYKKISNEKTNIIEDIKEEVKEEETIVDGKRIGSEKLGYVTVPNDWVEFTDVDNPNVFQYSNRAGQYIVTMNSANSRALPESVVSEMAEYVESEGAKASYKTITINKYDGYVVNALYDSGTYIDIYFLLDSDTNTVHYISIEGPDNTSEYFDIPKTFSSKK